MKYQRFAALVLAAALLLTGCGGAAAPAAPAGSGAASQSGADTAVQTAQKDRITDQWSLEKTVRGEMIGVQKLSIHVPQFVCDSPDAAALNEELAAMYAAEYMDYESYPDAEVPQGEECSQTEINWDAYWYGDCVSLVMRSHDYDDAPWYYSGWCFDFATGRQITTAEMLQHMGLDPDEVQAQVQRQAMQAFDREMAQGAYYEGLRSGGNLSEMRMGTLEYNELENLCLLLPQQDRLVLRGKYCSETDWGWQQLDVEIPLTSAAPADTPVLTDTYDGVQVQLKGTQGTITLSPAPKTDQWGDIGIRVEQDHTYPILGIYNEYVTIATIESLESVDYDSMEAYADDLYDFCQFGYGSDMDGVLLLVSVGDRKWHISTCGYDITAFTDAGIQYLGEQMTPFMADGDYAGAFRTFVQWSDTYIDAARAGHPYDVNNLPREPLSPMYLVLALGIGLVLAWVVVSVMKSQLRSVAFHENAASYVREGSMNLTNSRELFLYRDVHRTERPK